MNKRRAAAGLDVNKFAAIVVGATAALLAISECAAQAAQKASQSPWRKICYDGVAQGTPAYCLTGTESRTEEGNLLTSVILVEPVGEGKILRVFVPLGALASDGVRLQLDKMPPVTAKIVQCRDICAADHPATPDLIARMKGASSITLRATNAQGKMATHAVSLAGFGKVNDTVGVDVKVFAAQQKKLEEDLQRRADELRTKLYGPSKE